MNGESSSVIAMGKLQLSYNAPFTLTFSLACVAIFVVSAFTGGWLMANFFSVGYGFSWTNPITWPTVFLHVLGHASPEHLVYNLLVILLLGPILEEKYKVKKLVLVTVVVAVVTALPMILIAPFFGQARLLGASGVVFAFIVLASYTRARAGVIPMTFALVCILFIGQEVYRALTTSDEVARFAHILGGLVGAYFARSWQGRG